MTNFEYLMQAQTPEQFNRLYYDHFNHGCRQSDVYGTRKMDVLNVG